MARVKDSSAILGEADGGFLTDEQERRAKAFLREREAEDRKAERQQGKEKDAAERRQIKEVDAAEKKYRKEKGISIMAKVKDGQMDPDDVEEQYQRHKKMQQAGYYDENKSKKERLSIVERVKNAISGGRGSAGGGGMNPTDIEKVPGKRQLKMAKGGKVSASKRADGCAVRGKTKGKIR